jgi:hypothetical protein
MRATTVALLHSALTTEGCGGGDPRALEYVTTQPTVAEVAGRYEMVAWQSGMPERTRSSADSAKAFVVDLEADGTFTATNVPQDEDDAPELVSTSGRWELGPVAGLGRSSETAGVWGVRFDSPSPVLPASLMGPIGRDNPPRSRSARR